MAATEAIRSFLLLCYLGETAEKVQLKIAIDIKDSLSFGTVYFPHSDISEASGLCKEHFQDGLVINRNTSLHKPFVS